MMTLQRRWLLFGHYGGRNTGDEAMLLGLTRGLDLESCRRLIIATKDGRPSGGVPKEARTVRFSLLRIVRTLLDVDGVVLGGGTHFHDDYAFTRLLRHYVYLTRILLICVIARMLGRRVAWLYVGIGPLRFRFTRILTRIGLWSANLVTVRDHSSAAHVALEGKRSVTFDVAVLNAPRDVRREADPGRVVGVSLTPLAIAADVTSEADRQLVEGLVAGFSEARGNGTLDAVRFFCFRGGARESDDELTSLAVAVCSEAGIPAEKLRYEEDPRATIASIADCEVFVATRFHSAVLAYACRRPLLILAYHRKLRDLRAEIGLTDQALIGLEDLDRLPAAITDLCASPERFVPDLSVDSAIAAAESGLHMWSELDAA